MRKFSEKILKNKYSGALAAFFIPITILYLSYLIIGLSPISWKSVLSLDLAGQYVHFFMELKDAIAGDGSIFYSFARTLGGEFIGMIAYYLASPFTFIIVALPKSAVGFAVALVILLKTGLCGLTMHFYLCKSQRADKLEAVIFSICYALSAYVVVYGSNLMWLDGVFILPIIAYSIESIVKKGKCAPLIFSLAYALYTNYYIGYMLCIFSAIYYLSVFFSEEHDGNLALDFLKNSFKAVGSAVCAVMCAAVMLLPAYRSLGFGKSEFMDPDKVLRPTATLLDRISKLFPSTYDAVDYNGLAYIYCGIFILMLMPLYFTLSSVSVKKKLSVGAILLILAASMSIDKLDIIWHGFQYPNWLNYRYSFILCFMMCMMASEVFLKRKEISSRWIYVVSAFIGLVLVQIEASGVKFFGFFESLILSFVMTCAYLIIMGALKNGKRSMLVSLVCVAVCFELLISSAVSLGKYGQDVIYTASGKIEGNIEKYSPAISAIKDNDRGFYRAERYGNRLNNDPFSLGINGLTSSTSTVNSSVISFMGSLGYLSHGNFTKYISVNPAADSLVGLKYIVSDKEINNGVYQIYDGFSSEEMYVYKNPFALPLAYVASNKARDIGINDKSAFENINEMYSAFVGEKANVFVPKTIRSSGRSGTVPVTENGITYYTDAAPGQSKYVTFKMKVNEGEELYCYFPSSRFEEFNVYVNGEFCVAMNDRDTYSVQYLGRQSEGEITVKLEWIEGAISMYSAVNYFYALDTEALENVCEKLSSSGLDIPDFDDTDIRGVVRSDDSGVMVTTIPYDTDWTVYVDGEKVETYKVCDTLLAFDIEEGEHNIRIRFVSRSFSLGLVLTVIGSIGLLTVFLHENGGIKENFIKISEFFTNLKRKSTSKDKKEAGEKLK